MYQNVDFSQFEIQMNYQIDNFNSIISDYNERLSESLNKISELFEQSKKEEAAKYLVDQLNEFMQENQRLLAENAKLSTQNVELQTKLNSHMNQNFNPNLINSGENDFEEEFSNINNEGEIGELKNKVEELENIIEKLKLGKENEFVKKDSGNFNLGDNSDNINNPNLREAFINVLNELKEKDAMINDLQNKIKENFNDNENEMKNQIINKI